MSRNEEVAGLLEEFADLLEARDVEYKPRAYRRAAENVRAYPAAVEGLADDGVEGVRRVEGVGEAIAEKIVEYVETGEIAELEQLREELPVDMEALTRVEGVGPKTVGTLYDALGITTLDELEEAARDGEIREVSGFGEKTEQNILENVQFAKEASERALLGEARPYGDRVREYLAGVDAVAAVELAGSIRRWRETIGDVDVLVATEDGEAVVDALLEWDVADDVIESGPTKASVRADGFRIDLRVVVPEEFGAALQYFTGSKEHNISLRNLAIERDRKINEYGVFRAAQSASGSRTQSDDDVSDVADPDAGQRVGERVAGETEEGVYAALDLEWMPPELREDRGELDAAASGDLPDLLEEGEIRGDLHTHTKWSDGNNTIREMAEGAASFGYDYLGISDHATGPGMVGGVGLSDDELREELEEIRAVDEAVGIDLFAGVEANISADGEISVGDDLLADLDCVVASPHSGLDGDGTDRIIAAIEHPHVDVIGHPTGRLLNRRSGIDLDVSRVAEAAAEHGVALEINSDPRRLDLEGGPVKTAVDAGATIAIDTDAHQPGTLSYVRYGVHTARRGWAERDDVLNAWDVERVREFLGL
ncbi:MAG: helix-hairpin-helix domain-containing protein [Haloarculaceae archaeon]